MSEEFEFAAELADEEESELRRSFGPRRQPRPRPRPRPHPHRPPHPRPGGWHRPRRPWPVPGGWYSEPPPAAGSDFVRWVQGCLASALGRGVPRNGVLGPATRRAIRIFQKQQGLPVTGIVDAATENTLQSACTEPGQPEPDGATGGADARELAFDFEEEGAEAAEQEFQVSGQVTVTIIRSNRVPVGALTGNEPGLREPGIYIIYVDGRAWYVGLAERSIYARFQDRLKALHDFDIAPACLAGRTIEWINVREPSVTGGGVGRRGQKSKSQPYRPLHGHAAVLPLLEQFYIKELGSREIKARGKVVKRGGNKQKEAVHFVSGGALIVTEGGGRIRRDAAAPI